MIIRIVAEQDLDGLIGVLSSFELTLQSSFWLHSDLIVVSLLDGMLFIKYCFTDDHILLMVNIHRGIGPTMEISLGTTSNGFSQFRLPVMRLLKR